MKRAKKRYNVMLRNDLGTWRKMGQFTKAVKAEDFIESCKMSDRKEIVQGYKDLHNEYKIEEITIYQKSSEAITLTTPYRKKRGKENDTL